MHVDDNRLTIEYFGTRTWVEPYGPDTFRVRQSLSRHMPGTTDALLSPKPTAIDAEVGDKEAVLINGCLKVVVNHKGGTRFYRISDGEDSPLCANQKNEFRPKTSDTFELVSNFEAYDDEKIYGMGQYEHGYLDQKGCTLDLHQINREISIPFFVSSRKYGFLWHNPALGHVEFAANRTRWHARACQGLDFLVTTNDSYAGILKNYASITGFAPEMPPWAAGFWQCKLRYRSQEELLSVARGYKERGLPLSVIVIDFFHWPMLGEFCFDEKYWPDPQAMVDELRSMGVELCVSVWPNVNRNCSKYNEMAKNNYLIRAERGEPYHHTFIDAYPEGQVSSQYFDSTNPEARRWLWKTIKENYGKYGIRLFWLDQCEPEIELPHFDNLRFWIGNGEEVANLYPLLHEKAFYEGLKDDGETEIATLCRAAWVGSQRYGVIAWSGDVDSSFDVLRAQVRAGLNMAMSGIPWWNTDIGGFKNGHVEDPSFHELLIRWFQYGVFCPVCRLHGVRSPANWGSVPELTGADNEVWSYGEEVYEILRRYVMLRERLKPYVLAQMKVASETGLPPMRPVFVDFPDDPASYQTDDAYLFGPDLLVAPVLYEGSRKRSVRLPTGATWTHIFTKEVFEGGQTITIDAPLEQIPVFTRGDLDLWQEMG